MTRRRVAGDWQGLLALEHQRLVLARDLRETHSIMAAAIIGALGNSYLRTGDYVRARDIYEQDKAMAVELGDRTEHTCPPILRAC